MTRTKVLRRICLLASALAVFGLGTEACGKQNEAPTETTVRTTPSSTQHEPSTTQKDVRTNVTHEPWSVAPPPGNRQ